MAEIDRCPWCGSDPQYVAYHDEEWGVPVRDDVALFNKLTLDTFQSGLSWLVVLRKREAIIESLQLNQPDRLARWTARDVDKALEDARIIRNRSKVNAAINNAQRFCELLETDRGFTEFLWSHVGGEPVVNAWKRDDEIPARSPQGDAMAAALKRLGFKWTGPTVCYAFMQAVGMVNDHLVTCHRYASCAAS